MNTLEWRRWERVSKTNQWKRRESLCVWRRVLPVRPQDTVVGHATSRGGTLVGMSATPSVANCTDGGDGLRVPETSLGAVPRRGSFTPGRDWRRSAWIGGVVWPL